MCCSSKNKIERRNNYFSTNFFDCSETMKAESINEELNVEESVNDPLAILQNN